MADTRLTGGATQPASDRHLLVVLGQDGDAPPATHAQAIVKDDGTLAIAKHRHAAPPPQHMKAPPRIAIGVSLGLLSALMLAHLLWVWSFTARLVPANETSATPHIRVHWLGLAFTPTVEWSLVLLVVFSAAAGSAAHLSLVFANRAGLKTLEPTWTWWYLLRPGAASIVGVIAYVVLKAGFLGTVTDRDQHSIAFAAAIGTLAGMFTDTLISKLRGALGASAFDEQTKGSGGDGTATAPTNQAPKPDTETVSQAQPLAPFELPVQQSVETVAPPVVVPEQPAVADPRVQQTDNRPSLEDGEQDVDQHPAPYPGSPFGNGGGRHEDGS